VITQMGDMRTTKATARAQINTSTRAGFAQTGASRNQSLFCRLAIPVAKTKGPGVVASNGVGTKSKIPLAVAPITMILPRASKGSLPPSIWVAR